MEAILKNIISLRAMLESMESSVGLSELNENQKSLRVSDLLCMSNLAHASKMKEHDNNDDFQRITGRAA